MATEPKVAVGICSSAELRFRFEGDYLCEGAVVAGEQEATAAPGGLGIEWRGKVYPSLVFTPTASNEGCFELQDVTIGVDFHWQRRENQRFRGALKLIPEAGKVVAVNLVGVEQYLESVISSEMSCTSSMPLLMAHAVISRGWLLAQIEHRGKTARTEMRQRPGETVRWWDREDHALFDVCADDHCQRYQGINRVVSKAAAEAVEATRGMALTSGDGRLVDTRFSKCCGGAFERFENCWDDTPSPCLVEARDWTDDRFPDLTDERNAREWIEGRPEAFCNTREAAVLREVLNDYDLETADFYRWTEEISQERIQQLLRDRGGVDVGEVVSIRALQRGTSGRIVRLEIVGTQGRSVIGKELMIRRALSETHLRSSAFTVEAVGEDSRGVPEMFRLRGAGWGHGVGLCQIGAAVMGARGYDYDAILAHYYPGSELKKMY